MATDEGKRTRGQRWLRALLAAAALGTLFALSRRADLAATLAALVAWMRASGPLGALAYAAIYVAATVALLPASALTLAAGFVYGPLLGTAIVSPASVAGATAAFLVGRGVARGWVQRQVESRPTFHALDGVMGAGGWRIVALLRLSPLFPFNLLNYALSLTRVSLPDFVLGSFLGMLPGTFLYVYLGSLVGNLADLAAGKTPASAVKQALFWGGLVATAAVTVVITRLARRQLKIEAPAQSRP